MEEVRKNEKDRHIAQAQPGQGGKKEQDRQKEQDQKGTGQQRPGQGDQTRR